MANLPPEIDHRIFTQYFIPSCLHVLGDHKDPFLMAHPEVILKLEIVFHHCFPNVVYSFTSTSMAFLVVSRHQHTLTTCPYY